LLLPKKGRGCCVYLYFDPVYAKEYVRYKFVRDLFFLFSFFLSLTKKQMQFFKLFFFLTLVSFVFALPMYKERQNDNTEAQDENDDESKPFVIHKGLPFQNESMGLELATPSSSASSSNNSISSSSSSSHASSSSC
jgi:hypothetical protein